MSLNQLVECNVESVFDSLSGGKYSHVVGDGGGCAHAPYLGRVKSQFV